MVAKKIVAIIGGGKENATQDDLKVAFETGKILIEHGYRIVTGGYSGIMEAAAKGARSATNYSDGDIIAIIPSYTKTDANVYNDIVIATGIGYARNQIIAATGDFIVAIGGGAGTLSEIAFAWQLGKIIYAYDSDGWSKELANRSLDKKRSDSIILVKTPNELITKISTHS